MTMLTRRAMLGVLVLGTAGCGTVIDRLTQPALPDALNPPGGLTRNPTAHLLNRATFGPRPNEIAAVAQMGHATWLEQQLNYESIDDNALNWRLRRYDTLRMIARDLRSFHGGRDKDYIRNELAVMTLLRAIFSKRELYEVMVGFWSDHFSLYHYKGDVAMLKTVDDRDVIRRHALSTFHDLLLGSAHSPAMLIYLDNVLNEQSHPNENYAREIMELHTLGVDGGYTEADVKEVARCFTGWSVDDRGEFTFISSWHDSGAKTVLGHTIPAGGGKSDGDRVLEILSNHPHTVRHVTTKLARRFVADDPPAELIAACSETWTATGGDMRAIVRTMLSHPAFAAAPPKLKRPFELLVSLLRATGAHYNGDVRLIDRLDSLGHRPFGWPMPDGYPDTADQWIGNMLGRWNLALDALDGSLPGVQVDLRGLQEAGELKNTLDSTLPFFSRLFLSRDLDAPDAAALREFVLNANNQQTALNHGQLVTLAGLLAASPAFQWR